MSTAGQSERSRRETGRGWEYTIAAHVLVAAAGQGRPLLIDHDGWPYVEIDIDDGVSWMDEFRGMTRARVLMGHAGTIVVGLDADGNVISPQNGCGPVG